MFNFFRKKKIKEYPITNVELLFFKNLVSILPSKYHYLATQVNDDFLIAYKSNVLGFKDSYTFLLNAKLESVYKNGKLPHYFILKGINIWNKVENKFYEIELDILSGYLGGFNIGNIDFSKYDFSRYDISGVHEKHFENEDLEKIIKVFSEDEKEIIKENIGSTYEIDLKEGKFYFFDDLDDGDVIALDVKGDVYALLHDPYTVKKVVTKEDLIIKLNKGSLKEDIIKLLNT